MGPGEGGDWLSRVFLHARQVITWTTSFMVMATEGLEGAYLGMDRDSDDFGVRIWITPLVSLTRHRSTAETTIRLQPRSPLRSAYPQPRQFQVYADRDCCLCLMLATPGYSQRVMQSLVLPDSFWSPSPQACNTVHKWSRNPGLAPPCQVESCGVTVVCQAGLILLFSCSSSPGDLHIGIAGQTLRSDRIGYSTSTTSTYLALGLY